MDKRTWILKTSQDVFFEFGYQKTTLEDIAERMQIQKGGIYYYFKSKEDLFLEVLRDQHEDYKEKTRQSIEGTRDFRQRGLAFFEGKIDYINEHTNERFSLSEDILRQFHFTGALLEEFQKWEILFIKEQIIPLLCQKKDDDDSDAWVDEVTTLLLIENAVISNDFPKKRQKEIQKQRHMKHVEVLITGIEATYKTLGEQ